MTRPISDIFREADLPHFDAEDASLSSGERALARIISTLTDEWDALDGAAQRSLVNALETSTQETEKAEAPARALRRDTTSQ